MNKVSLLTLVLVIALPGCGGSKNQSTESTKKSSVAKHMTFDGDIVEENDEDGTEYIDEDDNAIEFNFDEEDEDNDMSLEDLDGMDIMEEEENVEDDSDQAFRWIDAQTDDEFKTLYFTFNHYGIRADQKASVEYDVEQVKQLLSESGTTAQPTVVIEGHACQEGTPAYNVALSEKRAKIVADHFVAAGVPSSNIKVVGRGQECPAVINGKPVNGSREARWPNRRVEVRVIYT